MAKAIWEELAATKAALLQTISSFTQQQFNVVPFEGSWTAGQTSDHIRITASGGIAVLNGEGHPTERLPTEQIAPLRDLFLNFGIKMVTPEFGLPSNAPQDRDVLLHSLDAIFSEMITLSENMDLTLTFTDFEMPQFGLLTRLEWLSFIGFHTRRHIRQLQHIREQL